MEPDLLTAGLRVNFTLLVETKRMRFKVAVAFLLAAIIALVSPAVSFAAVTPLVLTISDETGDSATIVITGAVSCAGICSSAPGFPQVSPGSIVWPAAPNHQVNIPI